jgi:hypothetical protein
VRLGTQGQTLHYSYETCARDTSIEGKHTVQLDVDAAVGILVVATTVTPRGQRIGTPLLPRVLVSTSAFEI